MTTPCTRTQELLSEIRQLISSGVPPSSLPAELASLYFLLTDAE